VFVEAVDFAVHDEENRFADSGYHLNIPVNFLALGQNLVYQLKNPAVHKILSLDISRRGVAHGLWRNLITLYVFHYLILLHKQRKIPN